MSNYKVSVTNQSGDPANIAIFQTFPGQGAALSLIWLLKTINQGNKDSFGWEIDWALNWGTGDQPLAPGVVWSSSGDPQSMDPTGVKGNNAMGVSYSGGDFLTAPPAHYDASVSPGAMQVTTDSSFTVSQANNMSMAVYMNNLPSLAMQGKPNGTYTFHTHPTYYICTTEFEQGVAVDGAFLSKATEVKFDAGVTTLSFVLDEVLNFKPA